jgi:hypothetical protein
MTTYTLTQAQFLWLMNSVRADGANNNNAELINSLKPNSQEPVGFVHLFKWKDKQSERVVKITRNKKPEHGYTNALYTHPAPMSEEDMVKVLAALECNRVMGADDETGNYTIEITPKTTLEAIAIMKSAIEGMK